MDLHHTHTQTSLKVKVTRNKKLPFLCPFGGLHAVGFMFGETTLASSLNIFFLIHSHITRAVVERTLIRSL